MTWLELAACRGKDTALWFPGRGDSFGTDVARAICRSCPVKGECLSSALEEERWSGPPIGIRGGKTAEARAVLLRRRLTSTGEGIADEVVVPSRVGGTTSPAAVPPTMC